MFSQLPVTKKMIGTIEDRRQKKKNQKLHAEISAKFKLVK